MNINVGKENKIEATSPTNINTSSKMAFLSKVIIKMKIIINARNAKNFQNQ